MLSICIPTYNRAQFLSEALDSILEQQNKEIEIVISDNASTDNTDAVIMKYRKLFDNFIYEKQTYNRGFDNNILRTVELASSEYCWLLGSDDGLRPNALSDMLGQIDNSDIYICDRNNMTANFDKSLGVEKMVNTNTGCKYDSSKMNELTNFLNESTPLGGYFSYISTIIIKRSLWNASGRDNLYIGSGYIHVYKLFSMIKSGALIKYINLPLVNNRTGNDDILKTKGYPVRRLMDFNILDIINHVFDDNPIIVKCAIYNISKILFNIRIILTDKLSFYNNDPGKLLILCEKYRTNFKSERFYRIKMLVWKMMDKKFLNFAKYKFGTYK